jgi:hypothetical protein
MACPFGSGELRSQPPPKQRVLLFGLVVLQVLATLRFAACFPLLSLTRERMRFTEHLNTLLEISRKYSKKII